MNRPMTHSTDGWMPRSGRYSTLRSASPPTPEPGPPRLSVLVRVLRVGGFEIGGVTRLRDDVRATAGPRRVDVVHDRCGTGEHEDQAGHPDIEAMDVRRDGEG